MPRRLAISRLLSPSLAKLLHFRHELTCCHGPPMRFPILSCLVDSRLHAVPQNISLELRKHCQHPGQRSAAGGRQVERFAK